MYLHRGNPAAAAFWDWDSLGRAYAEPARLEDATVVAEIVELHEGPDSAALARHWLARQPGGFALVRGPDAEALGVIALITLHDATDEDRGADPLACAAWDTPMPMRPRAPGTR
jgi:hypothetical protein